MAAATKRTRRDDLSSRNYFLSMVSPLSVSEKGLTLVGQVEGQAGGEIPHHFVR